MEEAAADSGLDLPLIAMIRRRMEQAAEEHGDEHLAAVNLRSRPSQKSA